LVLRFTKPWTSHAEQPEKTLASEWQNFMSGQVKEDIAFVQLIL